MSERALQKRRLLSKAGAISSSIDEAAGGDWKDEGMFYFPSKSLEAKMDELIWEGKTVMLSKALP